MVIHEHPGVQVHNDFNDLYPTVITIWKILALYEKILIVPQISLACCVIDGQLNAVGLARCLDSVVLQQRTEGPFQLQHIGIVVPATSSSQTAEKQLQMILRCLESRDILEGLLCARD
ncbi:hypothetical protein ElyMa_002761500 [Elysia marginata]|uniref:Uncharacterized protein n=1 Tax=Elysia marginata TaxID=1093978 RepID=A0AAV4HJM2_9GAST|nr:hypothetical protein ElyMa_002761500 [Elysia marginata]